MEEDAVAVATTAVSTASDMSSRISFETMLILSSPTAVEEERLL